MSTYTPRRLQRSRKNPQLSYQQFLVFTIADQQFALPIESIDKVIQAPPLYGDPNHRGFGLITYQGEQLVVIDVEQYLFGGTRLTAVDSKTRLESAQFLILMKVDQANRNSQLIGLPVEQPPQLQRLSQQKITSLPDSYLRWGDIHGVTSVSVQDVETAEQTPTFILEPAAVLSTLANQEVIAPIELQPSTGLSSLDAATPAEDEIVDAITDLDSEASIDASPCLDDLEDTLEHQELQELESLEALDRSASVSEPIIDSVEEAEDEGITSPLPASLDSQHLIPSEPELDSLPEIPDLTDLPDLDFAEVEELFSAVLADDLELGD